MHGYAVFKGPTVEAAMEQMVAAMENRRIISHSVMFERHDGLDVVVTVIYEDRE